MVEFREETRNLPNCVSSNKEAIGAMGVEQFALTVLDDENRLLDELNVGPRLRQLCRAPKGIREFARAFYFVRYGFYRLNFIVGARSGPDETFWSGLALNLSEELGGFRTPTHNALYRDFLAEAGLPSEKGLRQPAFAANFNKRWETFCTKSSFRSALAGIAVYEVLDEPDYALLLEVMKKVGVGPRGLRFFEVHAHAKHFDLFEESMSQLWKASTGRQALNNGAKFVHSTQRMMWTGLLRHLGRVVPISN